VRHIRELRTNCVPESRLRIQCLLSTIYITPP